MQKIEMRGDKTFLLTEKKAKQGFYRKVKNVIDLKCIFTWVTKKSYS